MKRIVAFGAIALGVAAYFGPTAMASTSGHLLSDPMGKATIHEGAFSNSDAQQWNQQIVTYWYELSPKQQQEVIDDHITGINAAPFGVDTSKYLYDTKTQQWVTNPGYDTPRGYSYCPEEWDGMINPTCKTPQAKCHLPN